MEDKKIAFKSKIADYINDIDNSGFSSILSDEQVQELSRIILKSKNEDKRSNAVNELVSHNLRLVINIAHKLKSQIKDSGGVDFADLVSCGNIGLVTAAQTYDAKVGKFSTYAYYSILREIWQCINNQKSIIRIPKNQIQILFKLYKLKLEHTKYDINGLPQHLDIDTISDIMGIKKERIELIKRTNRQCNAKSLNVNINIEEDTLELIEAVEDKKSLREFNNVIDFCEKKEIVMNNMKHLSPQEQAVVFISVFAKEHYRLDDIKTHLKVSRERVRSILATGLRKMKMNVAKYISNDFEDNSVKFCHTKHRQKRCHNEKISNHFLTYEDLESISNAIIKEIVGDMPISMDEYINRAKNIDMKILGLRINNIIKNDIRLAAFLPVPIFDILRSRFLENVDFTKYDYDFVYKNKNMGYKWLAKHMYSSDELDILNIISSLA